MMKFEHAFFELCRRVDNQINGHTDKETERHRQAGHNTKLDWLRGTVAERRSLTGEFSLSHARPAADG